MKKTANKKINFHSLLITLFLLSLGFLLLLIGWRKLGNYHYQPKISLSDVKKEDFSSVELNFALEKEALKYEYKEILSSSKTAYQLILGTYKYYQNAINAKTKLEPIVGSGIVKKNDKGLWVLYSEIIPSIKRIDLIKIKLNRIGITPQVKKRQITNTPINQQ
jgi:hypothetical protein